MLPFHFFVGHDSVYKPKLNKIALLFLIIHTIFVIWYGIKMMTQEISVEVFEQFIRNLDYPISLLKKPTVIPEDGDFTGRGPMGTSILLGSVQWYFLGWLVSQAIEWARPQKVESAKETKK